MDPLVLHHRPRRRARRRGGIQGTTARAAVQRSGDVRARRGVGVCREDASAGDVVCRRRFTAGDRVRGERGEDEDDVADGADTVHDAAGGRGVRAVGGTGAEVPEGQIRGTGVLEE